MILTVVRAAVDIVVVLSIRDVAGIVAVSVKQLQAEESEVAACFGLVAYLEKHCGRVAVSRGNRSLCATTWPH